MLRWRFLSLENINGMVGPEARDPYARWFNLIKESADAEEDMDLVNLALLYRATGDLIYLDRFVEGVAGEGDPSLGELLGPSKTPTFLPERLSTAPRF